MKRRKNTWLSRLLRRLFRRQEKRSVYYIGGSDILPPPFSPEEERYWLSHLEEEDPLAKVARDRLIEHNLRLVVYIAKKFENTGIFVEDLISIGSIGLMKAISTFNPDKNIKLATYASRCIENEILMYLRRNQKTRSEVSLDEPLNMDVDGNELLLSDILGTDADIISRGLEDETDRELLREAMKVLGNRERAIIELRFGLGEKDNSRVVKEKTQKEVADLMGISQSYISRLEKKIMKRLYKEMRRLL